MPGHDRWRQQRRYLNEHRHELANAAAGCYAGLDRVGPVPLLGRPAWRPPTPVRLADVSLSWDPAAPPPLVSGTEPQSEPMRPPRHDRQRFGCYAEALSQLAPPRLLENRACYRLTSAVMETGTAAMTFTLGRYFDGLNVGEAVAHEFAAWHMTAKRAPTLADLPLRALAGDPADLTRRPVNPAISMLTLRGDGDGTAAFLLHRRDAAQVAHGGGLYQVLPVGVFQPSSDTRAAVRGDFDLWRCAVREYGEELLGAAETPTDGAPPDYGSWPLYRSLTRAREEGSLRSYLLGLGVDPLSLATDILAVTVIDAAVFDAVFARQVPRNAEGLVLGGFDFTRANVERFTTREPMQAAGAAALSVAWEHRELLAAPQS